MKNTFITFANTTSGFSQDRILFEAKNMEIFDEMTFFTEEDFDDDFLKKYGSHFRDYKRGYGYWSWKPYLILQELNRLNEGDTVVYADAGCMLLYKNRKKLAEWIDIARSSASGILSPCYGPYIEHDWTRGDLYEYIDKTYNKNHVDIFDKAVQCGAGVLVICKKKKSVEFIENWLDVMTEHFHLCTDEPSSVPNHPDFKENRHDQSVFSMLSKIYNIETIETQYGILNKESSPIIATRCRNDKNTWKKPIEILFDHQVYDQQKFGGISRMYYDMTNALNRNGIIESFGTNMPNRGNYQQYSVNFTIKNTNNEYLKDECMGGFPQAYNEEYAIRKLLEGDFDVFYPTYFSPYFLDYIGDKPFVMSVHDMIPELYPQYFNKDTDPQINGRKVLCPLATAIEVPTETTKRDLLRFLPDIDESKIHVISRSLDPEFGKQYYNKSIVPFKYILYVGQRWAYKRFDWFIKHITPFMQKHIDIHLICTGNGFNRQEQQLLTSYGIIDRTHTIFANDFELPTLYKYAELFIFPSEYEGFGLPILESYKMGGIALLNDTDCFREVTFNQGIFFNLKENESNLSDVAESIYNLSDAEKDEIRKKQYSIFSYYTQERYINNIKSMIDYAINPKSRDIEKPKKISIITVNYNNKTGLVNTINSVLRQTYYNNIEYIVIDGGSTDGSADLIRQCSEKLFYSVSEKDNGIYEAMNKGIEKATGDYCLFLNSGDYFCNNSVIESAVRYLDKDIVYGDIKLNGRMVKKYSSTLDVHYFDYESLPHPASFIKTSLLKERNYDTNFNIISDWIFFRESIARGVTYRHIDLPISNFFLGGKSSDEKALSKEKEKYFSSDGKWKNEITVIVPCYNYGKYIAETLDSLKTSTYQDFHCIIVNDGSTDDSEEIIKNAITGDNRFEYFRIDNHGVGYARNYGIRKSNSKYILCLDSDDKISPTYIENGIKYLNENDDVTLYYGNAQMFFDDGTSSDWYLPEFNYSRLLLSNQIYCSFIYRRSDYNRCGGYDEVMHGYEDWEFLVRLLDGKKVYRTDDVVFYYRRHNDSKDAQVSKDVRSYLRYIIGKNIPVYMKYGLITDNKKQDKSSLLTYNNVNKQSDNVSFVSIESLR